MIGGVVPGVFEEPLVGPDDGAVVPRPPGSPSGTFGPGGVRCGTSEPIGGDEGFACDGISIDGGATSRLCGGGSGELLDGISRTLEEAGGGQVDDGGDENVEDELDPLGG